MVVILLAGDDGQLRVTVAVALEWGQTVVVDVTVWVMTSCLTESQN